MESSPLAQPSPNGQRECDCPPWVLRCVHWEGQVLWLASLRHQDYPKAHRHQTAECFRVAVGQLAEPSCGCSPPHVFLEHRGKAPSRTDLYPAAEAEFARRNAELLGREAVSP
jgi:hypothetical protein